MARKERRGDERPGVPPVEPVKRIGGPRNEFGTRVARRIECSRCGGVDHVPYAPRDRAKALCRACAIEALNVYEVGVKARSKMRDVKCNLCGTPFQLPVTVVDDGDLLCRSCLIGFTAWQGSLDDSYEERQLAQAETRRAGTRLRRRGKHDPEA